MCTIRFIHMPIPAFFGYIKTHAIIFLGMFFLFYLALGASVFSAIESPIEQQEIKDLIQKKTDFVDKYSCIEGNGLCFLT